MGEGGLADARNVFNQQVAARQQAGHAVADMGGFAHNHRVKLIQQRLEFFFHMHALNDNVIFNMIYLS